MHEPNAQKISTSYIFPKFLLKQNKPLNCLKVLTIPAKISVSSHLMLIFYIQLARLKFKMERYTYTEMNLIRLCLLNGLIQIFYYRWVSLKHLKKSIKFIFIQVHLDHPCQDQFCQESVVTWTVLLNIQQAMDLPTVMPLFVNSVSPTMEWRLKKNSNTQVHMNHCHYMFTNSWLRLTQSHFNHN